MTQIFWKQKSGVERTLDDVCHDIEALKDEVIALKQLSNRKAFREKDLQSPPPPGVWC